MKKIIVLLITLLCLSGCTLNIELDFKENSVDSNINGEFTISEYIKKTANESYSTTSSAIEELNQLNNFTALQATDNNQNFAKNVTKSNETYNVNYEYSFTYDEFNNLNTQLNNCFDFYTAIEKDDIYYYTIQGNYKCDYSPTLTVTSENGIGINNADIKKDGKYTWIIKEENNDIKFSIYKHKAKESITKTLSSIRLVVSIIIIIISIGVFFIYRKMKNNY